MAIFPYEGEEERRRRRLPSPVNPVLDLAMGEIEAGRRPEVLPEAPMRPALPPPSTGVPGGMGMPRAPRPSRAEHLGEARDVYLQGTPGRGKSAAKGALQGFLGGGGLLGALTGGIYGAADPRGLREQEFERKVQPKIMRGFGLEDQERAQARQVEEDALNAQYKTAQIGELNRRSLPEPPKSPSYSSAPGLGIYNQQTGQIATPAPPPQPRELAPRPVLNERGEYVDFNAETKAGRKVKAFQKPKATGGAAKPKKEQKFVPLSKIREYAKQRGISRDAAEAEARADGYTVIR